MDFKDKAVVVTGAASGIGRATALAFARRGARLAIVDIDEEKLQGVRDELERMGTESYSHVVDVSDAAAVERLCEDVYAEMGRVDVLHNNAGVALAGTFESATLEDWEWIVGINLWGIIYGCHYFYPRMIAQGGGGHIVNTASAAGLFPAPMGTAYTVTKYGVVGFSEALRAEAALHGIGVSAICPGFVNTAIARSIRFTSRTEHSDIPQIIERTARVFELRNYTPDRVAKAVVRAVEKNKGVLPVCPEAYIVDWSHRFSLRKLSELSAKMNAWYYIKLL